MIYTAMTQSITPRSAVDAIAHLLTKTGELKGDDEAISLLDSMKESTLLFQRAIYLEVLKNTASEKTLTTYLHKGGWDLLNNWLADTKERRNNALALEILEVLDHVPVTLALLKQGNMGKVVRSFIKVDHQDKETKKIAAELKERWMKLVPQTRKGPAKQRGPEDSLSRKDQLVPKKTSSKSVHLAESGGFLDAITSTSKSTAPRKIRKRSSTDADFKRSNSLTEQTPEPSPVAKPTKVDKLSIAIEKPASPKVRDVIKPEMLLTNSPPPLPDKSHGNDNMFCFKRSKKRRRIKWKEDIEDIQYYECEEKSTNHKSFSDCLGKEYEKERQAVLRSRQLGEDMMVEMVSFKHPLKLDASMLTLAEKGGSSKEKDIQKEREKNVLAVLVFDQNKMDESPKEPDIEELTYTHVTPKVIPLNDNSQAEPAAPEPGQRHPEPAVEPPQQQPARYNDTPPQGLPPVLANMIPPHQQPMIPMVMPLPELLPHPDQYAMPVQRYPNQQNQPQPPQYHPNSQQQQQGHVTYNSYNNQEHRPYEPQNRNGRDYNKRGGDGGCWNYRKGGHGGRQYRDWIDGDRRHDDHRDQRSGYRPRRPCAYFNTKMGCREGNNCKFIHETGLHGSIPGQYTRWDDRDSRIHISRGGSDDRDGKDQGKPNKDSSEKHSVSESQENKSPSAPT